MPDANGEMQMSDAVKEDDAFIGIGRRSSVILMRLIAARCARLIRHLT